MKLAIMQPYLFPYIGYFQLINVVDRFISLDDVKYINRGWINRNRIRVNGEEFLFSLPLSHASQNKCINEIQISGDYVKWRGKFLLTLERTYANASFFKNGIRLINQILDCPVRSLSEFVLNSIKEICRYLEIRTEFIDSSEIFGNKHLKGEERIVTLCKLNQANIYFNLPGGRKLYSMERFDKEGIALKFLEPVLNPYTQGGNDFIPGLSIIDVLTWNGIEQIKIMLQSANES